MSRLSKRCHASVYFGGNNESKIVDINYAVNMNNRVGVNHTLNEQLKEERNTKMTIIDDLLEIGVTKMKNLNNKIKKCEFDIEGECHAAVCYDDRIYSAKTFNEDGSIKNINYISNEQLKKELTESYTH